MGTKPCPAASLFDSDPALSDAGNAGTWGCPACSDWGSRLPTAAANFASVAAGLVSVASMLPGARGTSAAAVLRAFTAADAAAEGTAAAFWTLPEGLCRAAGDPAEDCNLLRAARSGWATELAAGLLASLLVSCLSEHFAALGSTLESLAAATSAAGKSAAALLPSTGGTVAALVGSGLAASKASG